MRCAIAGVAGLFFLLAEGVAAHAAPDISAVLSVAPASYTGKCPAVIKFHGKISVSAPGKIQYKFVRSDGANAPVHTLVFQQAGSLPVATTWTLGGPGLPVSEGWQAIQVIYPRQAQSNKAEFTVRCMDAQSGRKPDLVVQDMKLDKDCNVMVKVRNSGAGNVPDGVWTEHKPDSCAVYLSKDGQGWGGETIWRFDSTKSLQVPGGSAVYRSNLKVSGDAVIRAEIDHTGQVDESNEANNVRTEKLSCGGGSVGQDVPVKEDCLSFNPTSAEVRQISGDWKIVDGSHWVFSFGSKKDEAYKALAIIRKYGLNRTCFVGRPDPSFTYLLVGAASPAGSMAGEDCVSFNPGTAEVRQISGDWKIADGNHWVFSFGNKKNEADKALAIIRKYGFNRTCYVGRPNPSFTYLRK